MDQFAVIMDYVIGTMSGDDWERVRSIYLEGIRTGHATFELEAPSWDRWDAGHLKDCRLVVRDGNGVIGWAAPPPPSPRPSHPRWPPTLHHATAQIKRERTGARAT